MPSFGGRHLDGGPQVESVGLTSGLCHMMRGQMASGAKSRVAAIGVVALVGCALGAGAAGASTTMLGETALTPSLTAPPITTGLDIPVFQGAAATGYVLRATHDGRVVSWQFLSAGIVTGRHFVLRVLEPVGATGTQWKTVGTSAAAAVVSETGTDAVNGPFPTSIPIKEGDAIAIEPTDGSQTPSHEGTIGGDGIRYFAGALAEGATGEVLSQENNGQRIPVQATIEYTPPGPPPGPPAPVAPTSLTAPSVTGATGSVVTPGQRLTCSPGTWTGASALDVRWYQQAVAANLPARIAAPRLLRSGPTVRVPGLVTGKQVFCRVVASAAGGSTVLATTPLIVQAARPALAKSRLVGRLGPLPRVISRVTPGNRDTCTSGVWVNHPTSFKYTWRLEPARRHGGAARLLSRVVGRSQTIKVRRGFAGKDLVCEVTAANPAGSLTISSVPASVPRLAELEGAPPLACAHPEGANGCPGTAINVIVPAQTAGKSLNPHTSLNEPLMSSAGPPGVPSASRFLLECEPPKFSRPAAVSYIWTVSALEFFSSGKFVEGGFVSESLQPGGHFITLDHGLFVDHESENPEFGELAWKLTTSDDKGHRLEKIGFFGFGEIAVSCTATGSAARTTDWGTSPVMYLDGRVGFGYVDRGVIGYTPVSPFEEELGYENE